MDFPTTKVVESRRQKCRTAFAGRSTLMPVDLAKCMVGKVFKRLPDDPEELMNMTFVDPVCGTGIFGAVVADYLYKRFESAIPDPKDRIHHIASEQIWMYDNSLAQVEVARELFPDFFESKIIRKDTLNESLSMKFDVAIGNPPYQENTGSSYAEAIWPDFLSRILDVTKEGGYISLIHPGGWRTPYGEFEDAKERILSRDLRFLSINDLDEGRKTFGVGTSYDWYVLKNEKIGETETTIEFTDGTETEGVNVSDLEFIPNRALQKLEDLVASDPSNRVDLIQDSSYHHMRDYVQNEKTEEYKHPVVYTVTQRNGVNKKYSSTNENGHFGVPKVIWSNGAGSYPIVDESGDFGMTQFAYAIADEPEVLPKIKEAMESEEFLDLMDAVALNDSHNYNRKAISAFRKDFWKEFVDKDD